MMTNDPLDEYRSLVRNRLSEPRWQHTLSCMEYATDLAIRFGLDIPRIRLAALLHDLFRDIDLSEAGEYAAKLGYAADAHELANPVLLHGPIAALWVEEHLHIEDAEILEAIRYHTTGAEGLRPLGVILYIADGLEPLRDFQAARRLRCDLVRLPLQAAALMTLEHNLEYLTSRGIPISPKSSAWYRQLQCEERLRSPKGNI